VFSDLNTWGWILIVVGVAAIVAAFYVMSGSEWARWTGIVVAGLQTIAQLLMVQAYPFWSLAVFAIDILVIYGLAAHGGSRARREA
jgi:phosphatidylserine synthase